ncbi:uncharacterized protein LOC119456584 [Dermacentor silvarum]|uniref:uncharacterized protein LOC119456584 n=1 Tax=Dermacentor silvarum TaxID=543639 RepID=UPI00210195A5|nr:uncharacterized protein LOC119456584 [Dermacentor silvarum]
MSGEAMVPPTGGLNVAPGAKVHLTRSGSVLWRGLLALQRYRLLHLGRHVAFYTLLLLMGALLFLVFCDRVASVRTPFPRALPRIALDPDVLRQGYLRNVTETADLAQAIINLGARHRIKFGKAKKSIGDSLSAGNFTARFAFELGTQALVSWYNVRTRRSEAVSLLLLQNAVLQYVSGNSAQRLEAAIEFLPGGASVSPVNVFTWLSDVELKLSGATFVPISLGLFSAAAALFPAVDQADGGRLLQRLAGLPGALYWLSNMFWDYAVLYMLYMLLLSPMVVIWGFGDSVEFWVSVILLFAAYGWAAIPLSYVLSQWSGPRPSRAFSLAVVVKCVFGVLSVLYVIRLHLSFYVGEEESLSRELLELISTITRMVPTVSISWGLGRAMWLTSLNELCHMDNDADFMQRCSDDAARLGSALNDGRRSDTACHGNVGQQTPATRDYESQAAATASKRRECGTQMSGKKAILAQYLRTQEEKQQVILLQETIIEDVPVNGYEVSVRKAENGRGGAVDGIPNLNEIAHARERGLTYRPGALGPSRPGLPHPNGVHRIDETDFYTSITSSDLLSQLRAIQGACEVAGDFGLPVPTWVTPKEGR